MPIKKKTSKKAVKQLKPKSEWVRGDFSSKNRLAANTPPSKIDRDALVIKLGLLPKRANDGKILYALSRLRNHPRDVKALGITDAEFKAFG